MGQAGSTEQKIAIRDVVNIKPGAHGKAEKDAMRQALQTFCTMFPLEQRESLEEANGAVVLDVKERKLFDVVHAALQEQTERTERGSNEDLIELLLISFKRVIMWRELHRLCAKCSIKPFLNCLLLSPKVALLVLETILQMITACPGAESAEKSDKWESSNRRNFGEGGGFEVLRSLMVQYSAGENQSPAHEDILRNVLMLFHLTLVARRNTSDVFTCMQAVGALLNARISLLDLCHHADPVIQDYAIDLVKELFLLIDLEQVHDLQESAREYGALLYALSVAVDKTNNTDKSDDSSSEKEETPTNSTQGRVDKCIDLVEMFCAGNTRSKKAMYRIFPVELFIPVESRQDLISRHTASSLLKSTRNNRSMPHFSFDFDSKSSADNKRNRVMSMATTARNAGNGAFQNWLSDARSQGECWRNIILAVVDTHERPELVWRDEMRIELREALQLEIETLESRRRSDEATASIARWDHEMFYVNYQSMQRELIVNGYFIEYLIPKLADLANSYEVVEPIVLAWHLSDHLAVEINQQWRLLCVRCLRLLIRRYAMLFHGQLPTRHVLALLENHNEQPLEFVRECFSLLSTAIETTRNAPSESLNRQSTLVASSVINVLSDPLFLSNLATCENNDRDTEDEDSDDEDLIDGEEDQVYVNNESDATVRAGVNVLLAIVRRSKFSLLLIRPKRVFMCRLLAVETLDHITISRLLLILKQLSALDQNSGNYNAIVAHRGSGKSTMDTNWKSLALVYMLFASCDPKGMGMCLPVAEFLKENFTDISQSTNPANSTNIATTKSEFSDLLSEALGFGGCGMGQLLNSCSSESFTDVFNAHEKRAADVSWGRQQRARLFLFLKRKFVATSGNQHESDAETPSKYDNADDEVFVGNIFLNSYVEGDGQFLNVWTTEMYTSLINALFLRLLDLGRTKSVFGGINDLAKHRAGREPWEIQVLILKALVRLVPAQCANVEIKREYYESLLTPLRRTLLGDSDQIRGILAMELLIAILSSTREENVNTAICRSFLGEKGLSVVGEALDRMLNPTYQSLLKFSDAGVTNTARVLLYRVTEVLSTLAKHQDGIQAIKQNPALVISLLELSSKQTIMLYSEDAAAVCLSCLTSMCQSEVLCRVVVDAGGLLTLIETSAFCPAEEIAEVPVSADEEGNSSSSSSNSESPVVLQRKPTRFFSAVKNAALVLRACLDAKPSDDSPTFQVLKQLLTPSFVRILRASPEKFISQLQCAEDINSATLIWTNSMRKRLQDCLALELSKVKTAEQADVWPRWNFEHFVAADSFRYQYSELSEELILHDVYLNNFVAADEVYLDGIDMASFSEALLISIQSNENVLRILQQRGASDPGKDVAVGVMRQALDKLVSVHPQHNLEVRPVPTPVMGSPAEPSLDSSRPSSLSSSSSSAASPAPGMNTVQILRRMSSESLNLDDLIV